MLKAAFGQQDEGKLVERLRRNPSFIPGLSLVAVVDGRITGYILFFPIAVVSKDNHHKSLALAPMAVAPGYQRKGIGGRLVREGLRRAKAMGHRSVIVVGHPGYYPRFGFMPASRWNIKAPFDVPDNALLALELTEDALKGVEGVIKYPEEFGDA